MRSAIFAAALACTPLTAQADDYQVFGYGNNTCESVIAAMQSEDPLQRGQVVGWILGFWSAASATRDAEFRKTMAEAGARQALDATLAQCEKNPQAQLVAVTVQLIRATN